MHPFRARAVTGITSSSLRLKARALLPRPCRSLLPPPPPDLLPETDEPMASFLLLASTPPPPAGDGALRLFAARVASALASPTRPPGSPPPPPSMSAPRPAVVFFFVLFNLLSREGVVTWCEVCDTTRISPSSSSGWASMGRCFICYGLVTSVSKYLGTGLVLKREISSPFFCGEKNKFT